MDLKRLFAKGLRVALQRPALTNCKIDPSSRVCSGSQLNYTKLGRYSYIGHDCFTVNAEIGSFCSIADNCRIGGAPHRMDYVSTSPVFCDGKNVMRKNFAHHQDGRIEPITVGSDVWIGAGATVMSGVNVGCGAVIGACSVVTKDVPPYGIVVGNPAHLIRYRFRDDVIKELIDLQWWNWSDRKLTEAAGLFRDPDSFIKHYKKVGQ